jgi:ParB family chromosome partitioning protein
MSAKKARLGRGLGALIQEVPTAAQAAGEPDEVRRIAIDRIRKNPWQPRRQFDAEALHDLVESIRKNGVLQPLLVRKVKDHFELIAGERRLRAAQECGLGEVPVVLMDVNDQGALELALIENLQREDLNPIEEADGFHQLMEQFHMTQERVAEQVGKGRATVANALRLLTLPDEIKTLLAEGQLSEGHAKVLLGLDIPEEQSLLARQVVREGLSVRALEMLLQRQKATPKKHRAERSDIPREHVQYLTDKLQHNLGTSVHLVPCKTLANGKKAKGKIEIDFYSSDDLDRLLTLLGVREEL